MNRFRTIVQGALDRARPLRARLRRTGHRPLALAAAVALLVSALGPPAPAGVAAALAEPVARLQLVVKEVKIHDDREGLLSGDGEMLLFVGIWRCNEGIPPPCLFHGAQGAPEILPENVASTAGAIARAGKHFIAGTGDTVTLDREVPLAGDLMWGGNTSPELGFAVYAGERYVVQFDMDESDGDETPNYDEYMGYVFHYLDTGENGLGIGTHTARSLRDDGVSDGDYTITYEIRPTPLPDVEPVNIRVDDLPGTPQKRVCMAVLNRGATHAGPFEVTLRVDGVVPPDGTYPVSLLASGTDYLTCVRTTLPTSGQHVLAAVVDAAHALPEFNEANNVYEQSYTAPPRLDSSTEPGPTPSPDRADLTVSEIRVNGQAPDGKDDCTDGKNAVTVVVKNGGTGKAEDFVVRLVVDGDDEAKEKLVADLEAGQEREVRFDDVRLKQGERILTALADSKDTVAESTEDNNEREATARCKDDD